MEIPMRNPTLPLFLPLLLALLLALALAACEQAPPPAATPTATDPGKGERVFKQVCKACHGTGAGGAPRLGNPDQWKSRVTQGNEQLYRQAITGFKGAHGIMPPRGGKPDLTDEEVRAAVDYMLSALPAT
jgi:cytochrome c5